MNGLIYHLRYSFHLYRKVAGMSPLFALRYPLPDKESRSDSPETDADDELSYWDD